MTYKKGITSHQRGAHKFYFTKFNKGARGKDNG